MFNLDIFFLFIFVLSVVHILNLVLAIVRNIFSEDPKRLLYSTWEKISNYILISYFLTYIIKLL
jgi:hypothetical protein